MWPYIETLLPTIGMLFLLYLVMKHILEGDRRERKANAEWDRQHAESIESSQDSESA